MLRNTLLLGRIAGVRTFVHWSLGVTLALLTWLLAESILPNRLPQATTSQSWSAGIFAASAFVLSLLAHELAHSIVAVRMGVRVDRVTLWMLGGMSELRDEPADPRSDLAIAVAGPLTSLAIGISSLTTAFAIDPFAPEIVTVTVAWLGTTNVVLALFNALPGAPLDGGRILRAWLWRRSGDRLHAAATAARSGRNIGAAMILLGMAEALTLGSAGGLWLTLLGWFIVGSANRELPTATSTSEALRFTHRVDSQHRSKE